MVVPVLVSGPTLVRVKVVKGRRRRERKPGMMLLLLVAAMMRRMDEVVRMRVVVGVSFRVGEGFELYSLLGRRTWRER